MNCANCGELIYQLANINSSSDSWRHSKTGYQSCVDSITHARPEEKSDNMQCKHCGKEIKWSSVFGWYHGVMGAGWNTSCDSDAGRAEPTEEYQVDDEAKNKMADTIQAEAKYLSWDAVHYDRDEAMRIVDAFINAGWAPIDTKSGLDKLKEANALFEENHEG